MTAVPLGRPRAVESSSTGSRSAALVIGLLACAVVLDAWDRPIPAAPMLWLDLAAFVAVGWSVLAPGAEWTRACWFTPFDGRIAAGLTLGVLDLFATHGDPARVTWLHQMLVGAILYYALHSRLRREPRGTDLVWIPFGLIALALGCHAMLTATSGLAPLRAAAANADVAWSSTDGLAKALIFTTIVCVGRSVEPSASRRWRVIALVGAVGAVLHVLAGGLMLDTRALARLDEPMYFSTIAVTMLLLFSLIRQSWLLGRDRAGERSRWIGLAIAFAAIAFVGVFGASTGGEGVRLIAVLGTVAVMAGRDARVLGSEAPSQLARMPEEPAAASIARAA